jgi:hypothetical protein
VTLREHAALGEQQSATRTSYADREQPLAAYAGTAAGFGAALTLTIVALKRSGRLPERLDKEDMILAGIATHKLTRLVARDRVTSFLRAPFTSNQITDHGEIEEAPRGTGMQRAIGELLSCPYCLAQWVAAAFACGYAAAPRTTRFIASIYAMETISDSLQVAYRAANRSG